MIHYIVKLQTVPRAMCSLSIEKELGSLLIASVLVSYGKPFQTFQAVFFPMRNNSLVESHPVNAWNSDNARLVSGPSSTLS